MGNTQQLVMVEVEYLIDRINDILTEKNVPSKVAVTASIEHNEVEVLTNIQLSYIHHKDNEEPIEVFFSKITVDPAYYFHNEESILYELNKQFFNEILLHTNFNTQINWQELAEIYRTN